MIEEPRKDNLRRSRVSTRKTVLVVSDEVHVSRAFCLFFENHGLHVSSASNAAEALGLMEGATHFDAVFIVLMPSRDCAELIAKLRENGKTLPAVVIPFDNNTRQQLAGLGNVQILYQPINCDDILNALERATF